MPGIGLSLPFHPLGMAVLTISDTRTLATDASGALLVERLLTAGHTLHARALVKDGIDAIQDQLQSWLCIMKLR